MKASRWVVIAAVLLLAAGAFLGGYHLYQGHLSGEVERLLIAANDEHASMDEVQQYIAQARPLVRTRRDREVLKQFEDALALSASVKEDEQKDADQYRDTLRSIENPDDEDDECYGNFRKLLHISQKYQEMGIAVPKDLHDHLHEALNDGKACEDRLEQESKARTVREKKNEELAVQELNAVRVAIGLPPIPKS